MKKTTLLRAAGLMIASAGLSFSLSAQTFSLSNYTPVINVTDLFAQSESHVDLSNTSSSLKRVTVERSINTLAPGHMEFFCFGTGSTAACYPPGTPASGGNDTILANTTDASFKGTILPMGYPGYTSIHYRFIDTDNPSDSVGVDLAWNFTTSLGENNQQYGLSKPLQNPADAFTVFNYYLPTADSRDQLVVYNMLGAVVRVLDIPGKHGALVLNTSDLKSGVYIVSFINGGRLKDSCRLVVSHR
ncbi:MAG: T9SS type A sorting domain-containing protein [Sphingobacteriales bacterium]|jgi:hypothetical protein|nr:T9SS type A sorting domain-containing protein [Sphingobacteriales bacterium]